MVTECLTILCFVFIEEISTETVINVLDKALARLEELKKPGAQGEQGEVYEREPSWDAPTPGEEGVVAGVKKAAKAVTTAATNGAAAVKAAWAATWEEEKEPTFADV